MIRQKIFRRIALLITNLIVSSLIILVVFSIIEQRRQINNYILSNGQVFANGLERLILWDDIYAIEKSLDILLESDSFYRYILVINENELYAESCICKGLKSDKLLNMVSENPVKPYTWTFEDEEGRVFFEAVIPIRNTDAFLRIGMARKMIDRQLLNYILMILLIGFILLVAGIIFSHKIAKRSTVEITLLSEEINNYRNSFNDNSISDSGDETSTEKLVESFKRLVSERREAEKQIRKSLNEKDVLLREIYHRTGNNMQIISSLLFLQCDQCSEPESITLAEKLDCRIQVMAIAHQMMYDSTDLSSISVKKYVTDLSSFLLYKYSKYSSSILLNLDVEDFSMLYDKAVPIGLILNELINNSFFHAFSGQREGEINIKISRDLSRNGRVVFIYSDTGSGVPIDTDAENNGDSLGIKIITSLAEGQLQGVLDFKNDSGYECRLEFDT